MTVIGVAFVLEIPGEIMKSALYSTVTHQARRIRAWCEAENAGQGHPSRTKSLAGWCAIASARLWKELVAVGVNAEICMALNGSSAHVFLVIEDHVVDVTATQFQAFRDQKLNIMHVKEAEQYWYYRPIKVFQTPDKLREDQVTTGWPASQTALP